MRAEGFRPTQTTAEMVFRLGDQASIFLDYDEKDGAPPCLCIHDGPVQVLLYPLGWVELGQVTDLPKDRIPPTGRVDHQISGALKVSSATA